MPRSRASSGSRPTPDQQFWGLQAGFSLIEVLVALALVGWMLAATAGVFGTGLLIDAAANGSDTALALAEDRLDSAGVDGKMAPGTTEGATPLSKSNIGIMDCPLTPNGRMPMDGPTLNVALVKKQEEKLRKIVD